MWNRVGGVQTGSSPCLPASTMFMAENSRGASSFSKELLRPEEDAVHEAVMPVVPGARLRLMEGMVLLEGRKAFCWKSYWFLSD